MTPPSTAMPTREEIAALISKIERVVGPDDKTRTTERDGTTALDILWSYFTMLNRTPATEPLADQGDEADLQLIDERDAAEEALSQAYFLVTGRSPEWSNLFGHKEALEEIDEALYLLRTAARAAQSSVPPREPTEAML